MFVSTQSPLLKAVFSEMSDRRTRARVYVFHFPTDMHSSRRALFSCVFLVLIYGDTHLSHISTYMEENQWHSTVMSIALSNYRNLPPPPLLRL